MTRWTRPAAAALAGAATAAALAGCSGSADQGQSAGTARAQAATPLALSVPPTATSGTVDLALHPGDLAPGTEVQLYAYKSEWGESPDCSGITLDPAVVVEVDDDPGPMRVSATVPGGSGSWWWVVAAPGMSSPCGAPGSQTRVLAAPELELTQDDASQALSDYETEGGPYAGQPYKFRVGVSESAPEAAPWKLTATWYGPFPNTPEASASGCGSDSPVAAVAGVETPEQGAHPAEVTLNQPGVYQVRLALAASDYTNGGSTGCGENGTYVTVDPASEAPAPKQPAPKNTNKKPGKTPDAAEGQKPQQRGR